MRIPDPPYALICSLGFASPLLLAASDPLALLSDSFAPELADGELAHLRSRYVSSHGISYFGIEFISSPDHGPGPANGRHEPGAERGTKQTQAGCARQG